MNWTGITSIFIFSTIKFLFAPFTGQKLHLTYWETYFGCVSGAVFCAIVFYFSSEFFMIRARKKRHRLYHEAIQKGIEYKKKRNFTKMNKFIVKIKKRLGLYGIAIYAPFFLSIPLGSIITAKFYGKEKKTFFVILFGIFMNAFITTTLAYANTLF